MKIVFDDGGVVVIKFNQTHFKEIPGVGWPECHAQPEILLRDDIVFTGTEVDMTGCSMARAQGHRQMTQECFNWIVNNLIR